MAADDSLVESLLEALVAGDTSAEARLEQMFTASVVERELARATRLRLQVVEYFARNRNMSGMRERVNRSMVSDAAIAVILELLGSCAGDALDEVLALAHVLPGVAAPRMLAGLAELVNGERRRAVCDIVSTWGPAALDAAVAALPNASEAFTLDLLHLLRRIGNDRAIGVLERAVGHAMPTVRAAAVRYRAELAPASPAVKAALVDDDELVRTAALAAVVAERPDGCARWIVDLVDATTFADRELAEKIRLLHAYALTGGETAAQSLIERLGQRNLTMRSSIDDDRIAAASALGEIGYAGARPLLDKLATAKLVRSAVSEACAGALAKLDRPPPEPVQPVIHLAFRSPTIDLPAAMLPDEPSVNIAFVVRQTGVVPIAGRVSSTPASDEAIANSSRGAPLSPAQLKAAIDRRGRPPSAPPEEPAASGATASADRVSQTPAPEAANASSSREAPVSLAQVNAAMQRRARTMSGQVKRVPAPKPEGETIRVPIIKKLIVEKSQPMFVGPVAAPEPVIAKPAPVAKPVDKPAPAPIAKPVDKPAPAPIAKPVDTPTPPPPVGRPAPFATPVRPAVQPLASRSVAKPPLVTAKPADTPAFAFKPVDKPTPKPVDKPTPKPVDTPNAEAANPVDRPFDKPAAQPAKPPTRPAIVDKPLGTQRLMASKGKRSTRQPPTKPEAKPEPTTDGRGYSTRSAPERFRPQTKGPRRG